jgi:hypothetical protein
MPRHGKVAFLQGVGVTAQEKAKMVGTSTVRPVLERLAVGKPLLVTDPARGLCTEELVA